MNKPPIVDSIAASRNLIGAGAARQFDLAFRQIMRGQGAVETESYLRLITGAQHSLGNMAIISDPNCEEITDSAVSPLLDLAVPVMAIYTEGVSDVLAQKLLQQGFQLAAMPAMAIEIDRLPPTVLPFGYTWTRIDAGKDSAEWAMVLAAGYPLPPELARMFSPHCIGVDMAADARMQFFGIWHQGRLAATSMLYLADGFAGVYCVATLPQERRKGLGSFVTAEALRVAYKMGYRIGVLQSSDDGHCVYLKLGFVDLFSVPMFIRLPG